MGYGQCTKQLTGARLRASYELANAVAPHMDAIRTGRLSSHEMQAEQARTASAAVTSDFSQLELRVLAHYASKSESPTD